MNYYEGREIKNIYENNEVQIFSSENNNQNQLI